MYRLMQVIGLLSILLISGCAVTPQGDTPGANSVTAKKKILADVVMDELVKDTQVNLKGGGDNRGGDNRLALTWWIPNEFWESVTSRDPTTSATDKEAILNAMSGITLLGVVQADISAFGTFNYYSKEEIEENIQISYVSSDGATLKLLPLKKTSSDLNIILSIIKPILEGAMGNLGSNFHIFVLNDRTSSGLRLIDPYNIGAIYVQAKGRDDVKMNANIELPLNSLFIPRMCPNGKEAHVSWNFCPWSGKRL